MKIKVSTALFIVFVTNICDMPDMSWTMLSLVVVLQYPINIPSPSVSYYHLLVVFVPVTCTMARSLHLTLLPGYEFQNGFLLYKAKTFSYKTVMIFTNVAEVQAQNFNLFEREYFLKKKMVVF